MLVDSHCHLDYEAFEKDLDELLQNAQSRGVKYFQTICTKVREFQKILDLVNKYECIYGSVGNHPNEVDNEALISVEEIIECTKHPKIISIGETGLDYYYEYSDRKKQTQSFINHIEAARITNLPVIIHTRDAEEDTLKILDQEMRKGEFKALIHCFTASKDFALKVLEMGLYISVAGIVTFKNAEDLRNVIKEVPLERLLVETDAPYLAPVPNRGKRNEPAFVTDTARFLAEIKQVPFDELSLATTNNFFKLFDKAKA